MEDHTPQAIRKNLNILSVVILFLAFSNARIDTINTFGMNLSMNGHKLYIGLFVLYFYFLWRFLTKLNFKGGFWKEFERYLYVSNEGVKRKYSFSKIPNEYFAASPSFEYAMKNDPYATISDLIIRKVDSKKMLKISLSLGFYQSVNEEERENGKLSNDYVDISKTITYWFILNRLIVFSIKYDKFGDELFPLVPVLVNVFFFFLSREWQGGFNQLIILN